MKSLLLLLGICAVAMPFQAAPVRAETVARLVPATSTGYLDTCNIVDDEATNLCDVAVVLGGGSYLGLGNFRIVLDGVSWTPVSFETDYQYIGVPWTGFSSVFGSCISSPIVVVKIRYVCPGTSPCGRLYIDNEPAHMASIERCDMTLDDLVFRENLTVNGVAEFPPAGPYCYCPTNPSEPSTWGQIKALYR